MRSFKIIKYVFATIVMVIIMTSFTYAADIRMQLLYGINNQAKSGTYLPLEVNLANRDNTDFEGYIVVSVYESNTSIYKYKQSIFIGKKSSITKNMNISVSPRNNTIIATLYDIDDERQNEERINIDLETLSNRLLIGVISKSPSRLMYLDDIQLKNGSIRTKVVNIENQDVERNRNILSLLDCLFISDINNSELSDSMNFAIENFIKDGKVVFLGTGRNGTLSFPKVLQKYLYGPTIDKPVIYDFNRYLGQNKNDNIMTLPSTKYEFVGNTPIYSVGDNDYISNLSIGSGLVCNCMFSFNDIDEYMAKDNTFIIKLIENTFGDNRLSRINYNSNMISSDDYYGIKSIVDVVDNENLPNIFTYILFLSIYIIIITIVLYAVLRGINKTKSYPVFAGGLSIVSCIILYCILSQTRQSGTFLTYMSMIEMNEDDSMETAFLNFRTIDKKSFGFNTSNNNTIYPMLGNTNDPILVDNDAFLERKVTSLEIENNVIYINVDNADNFDPSIFVYQSRNVDISGLNIDVAVNLFDGEVDGRVTNKMDIDIKDTSIITYGKVIYIGDIAKKSSITLKKANVFNVPIANNNMISELMCYYPRTKMARYYLENNIHQYYNGAKFVGFIDDKNTIDYNSMDVSKESGTTMIIKDVAFKRSDNKKYDVSSLNHSVSNI
ncbi:MAG: hypothetical protein MJ151_02130, partial [Lachnospiraceae bacterium]|nr:hypothetical protein [Lachnospiraceae bacterium]